MDKISILGVDDEVDMLEVIEDSLCAFGDVEVVSSPKEAVTRLDKGCFDMVVTDLKMPEMSGLDFLETVLASHPDLIVIMITGYPTVEDAVEAMKKGAYDFVTKPFQPEHLRMVVRRALQQRGLRRDVDFYSRQLRGAGLTGELIGNSPHMQEIKSLINRVAPLENNVLITGETGTGKSLVAMMIHRNSRQNKERFVAVNCGEFPENLLESELFGHVKGAFTGAFTRRTGLLEYAKNGTLFLDEICDLPLSLQGKLLGVFQDRTFRPIGSQDPLPFQARMIAATNRNVEAEVSAGRLREDLYYRMNVLRIDFPPLRDRISDIRPLAQHFLARFKGRNPKQMKRIDPAVWPLLESYAWPGNVRELQNLMERAVALTETDTIVPSDFPDTLKTQQDQHVNRFITGKPFREALDRHMKAFYKAYFTTLLGETHGNVTQAATRAGLPRNTLYRYLKHCGLHVHDRKSDP